MLLITWRSKGGPFRSAVDLKSYLRGKLEERLGTPPDWETYRDLWLADENQKYINYMDLATICRLYMFVDMGASLPSDLVPDNPWTSVDDLDHLIPASTDPAPANIHAIGNLAFLPASVNKSIQDMEWTDKKQLYALLASPLKVTPAPTLLASGQPLPPAVQKFLADPGTPALGAPAVPLRVTRLERGRDHGAQPRDAPQRLERALFTVADLNAVLRLTTRRSTWSKRVVAFAETLLT